MPLGQQAKILSKAQVDALLGYVSRKRYPERNRAIVLLSVKAGLRAKEIAGLTWAMVTDATGQVGSAIHLQDIASKGRSGRIIPLNSELRDALVSWQVSSASLSSVFVVSTERSLRTSAQAIVNLFARWYAELGLVGCSSHSGRRTFITNAARRISTVGGSLRDVQILAGHSNLRTTQRYIETDVEAHRRIVNLI
jgi:integrase/recombinase XerD